MCLVLIKILYYSHNSVCHCPLHDGDDNSGLLCYSSVYILYINNNNYCSIIEQNLVTEIFNLRLFSSNTLRLHARLTELLLTQLRALPCILHVFEGDCSWLRLLEISIKVNIVVYIHYCSVVYVFCLHLFLYLCLWISVYLFTIFCAGVCCYLTQCGNL